MCEPSYDPYPELDEQLDLMRAIEALPGRERFVMTRRVYFGENDREVGRHLDVTGSRINQIVRYAEHLIKRQLNRQPVEFVGGDENFWRYWRAQRQAVLYPHGPHKFGRQ